MVASRSFEALLADGTAAPVDGWDFSWFDGRATEERPPWGYSRMLATRLGHAEAALDIQTGGGEVLAESLSQASRNPRRVVATEGWAPNAGIVGRNLAPFGAAVALVHDVAAVIVFLRKVVWTVPGFSVESHLDRLEALHGRLHAGDPFVCHAERFLIEARRPD